MEIIAIGIGLVIVGVIAGVFIHSAWVMLVPVMLVGAWIVGVALAGEISHDDSVADFVLLSLVSAGVPSAAGVVLGRAISKVVARGRGTEDPPRK